MHQEGEVQIKILRRSTAPAEYSVYRAALEWDLTDPIVIESRDDLKSEQRWRGNVEPYHHQVTNLITFCRRLPVTLLADDVGLGKTISAGLVASELISRSRVSKILVVCPKLLGPQWREELGTKFGISSEIAAGKKLIVAEPKDVGAVITTYQSARQYLEKIPDDRFQMLILDEAHKLRNLYGVDPPPKVAVEFRKALEKRRFRYVLMLTATPIHNRLWDLYSLVDLLSVARGHQNPFGNEGMFVRKFIADNRDDARQLKPEAKEEFRSIVYGYMSRVRRGDAKLYFPEREVQLHRVPPTADELKLIDVISGPIQSLNRLAQISILQALTSSPHSLMAQLNNMARKGTVPHELAAAVRVVVEKMRPSAKLEGLRTLIECLKREKGDRWRMVVFTGRRETQTTIQAFLEEQGISVGLINGDSGERNQQTIGAFRENPPAIRVIVSTEAGSEGVNLQVANVLVNYDLPWNPMIVEQRIGRIQRLASEHAKVSILSIILRGTFEEYIVGRLMQKLQMVSHAIGDIESLLEASGMDEDEDGASGFAEQLRKLVIASLAGKDTEKATRLAEQSIDDAKAKLEQEEASISAMLGSTDGAEYTGPKAPKLPSVERSMEAKEFTIAAFKALGARITPLDCGIYRIEEGGGREFVRFEDNGAGVLQPKSTLYAPGSAAFARLVDRVIASGIHQVRDADHDPDRVADEIGRRWIASFGGEPRSIKVQAAQRLFSGNALVRARATTQHDSYERLVSVRCSPRTNNVEGDASMMSPVPGVITSPHEIGIDLRNVAHAAQEDPAVAEFIRFYLERRAIEVAAAGNDERKRRKLEDEFTPRLQITIVGLEGRVHRRVRLKAEYGLDGNAQYSSTIQVTPLSEDVLEAPPLERCELSNRHVPADCLETCAISKKRALRHRLIASEISGRYAAPEFVTRCSLSNKAALKYEIEMSAVSGLPVARVLLKKSGISAKLAEPEHFGRCAFTNTEALKSELATSEVSGKLYRADEQLISALSNKAGHKSEFVECYETRQPVTADEAEQCEVTGKRVRPGILELCAVTGKRVLPSELERSTVSGKAALKKLFVASSISGARLLETEAVRSSYGKFCVPVEAKSCGWSGRQTHPDDMRVCSLTGIAVHFQHVKSQTDQQLLPIVELLDGHQRTADGQEHWGAITAKVSDALRISRVRVESAKLAPDGNHLAACCELKKFLGLQVQHAGLVFSTRDQAIVGRIAVGKRIGSGWVPISNG